MVGSQEDAEFEAMQTTYLALNSLEEAAQQRVLDYVANRLGLSFRPRADVQARPAAGASVDDEAESPPAATAGECAFGTFAELFDAARPKGQSDKALLGGYWLQICQGSESFDGFSVNKELKNLGEGIPNITSALDVLKGQKPALALQLKKAGKSRQARKTYKITVAGIKAVEGMIGG